MKSILDPSFKYTSSASTNLRKTFERIRREQKREMLAPPEPLHAAHSVVPINAKKGERK